MEGLVLGTDPESVFWLKPRKQIRNPHDVLSDPMRAPHERLAAIGVDGDRPTSSIEFRPGMSLSGEELVNRIADLVEILRGHYHPKHIAYRAGAWVNPEPLGGHIHLGWSKQLTPYSAEYNDWLWRLAEIVAAWQAQADYVVPKLFREEDLTNRTNYAIQNRRDFATRFAMRPEGGWSAVMNDKHFEFRFWPSWMNTPEAAYVVLGGAEVLVREIVSMQPGRRTDWPKFVERMYTDGGINPPAGPSLAAAFGVALKHNDVEDFAETWTA
jgi:hypothetical protein